MDPIWLIIAVLVALAYVVQTAAGFGAGIVLLTLGGQLVSIPELIAVMVPLSLLQTSWIAWRYREGICWSFLIKQVLPLMGSAMVVTFWLAKDVDAGHLKVWFGAMVLVLSLRELWALRRPGRASPVSATGGVLALLSAGVVHGIYATGGPLLVYAAGRQGFNKLNFRSTITMVWVLINSVLVVQLALAGRFSMETPKRQLMVVWGVPIGVVIGEWLYRRVDEHRFKVSVFGLLALASVALLFN